MADKADFGGDPRRRVFHIDTECYVVYVGSEPTDYKPFIRIGNSENLPKEVKDIVHSVVVTDNFTGNPIVERTNMNVENLSEPKYVGDPEIVTRFKTYIRQFALPTEGFQAYHGRPRGSDGSLAYFYENGNIKLFFRRAEVFDLKTRERQDRHFLQQARDIKLALDKNPLTYSQKDLSKNGFLVAGGHFYGYSKGRLLSWEPPTEYFSSLARSGIDPDRVGAVMVQDAGEGLFRLFKRGRDIGSTVRVLAGDSAHTRKGADLFTLSDKLRVEVASLNKERRYHFGELSVGMDSSPYVRYPGIEGDLRVVQSGLGTADPAGDNAAWRIDLDRLVLSKTGDVGTGRGSGFGIREGVLHRVAGAFADAGALADEYIPAEQKAIVQLLPPREVEVLASLAQVVKEAAAGSISQKATSRLSAALKIGSDVHDVTRLYSANAVTLLEAVSAVSDDRDLRKAVNDRLSSIRSLAAADRLNALPGTTIDLYFRDGGPVALFHIADGITRDKIRNARDAANNLAEVAASPQEKYEAERKRLRDLVAGLDHPTVAPASTGPANARQTPRPSPKPTEKKSQPAKPPKPPDKTTPSTATAGDSPPSGAAADQQRRTGPVGPRPRQTRPPGPSRGRAILVAAAAVVVIAVLLFFLLPAFEPLRASLFGGDRDDAIVGGPNDAGEDGDSSGGTPSLDGPGTPSLDGPDTPGDTDTPGAGNGSTGDGAPGPSDGNGTQGPGDADASGGDTDQDGSRGPGDTPGPGETDASGADTGDASDTTPGSGRNGDRGTNGDTPGADGTDPRTSGEGDPDVARGDDAAVSYDDSGLPTVHGYDVTVRDVIALTNEIAVSNGYSHISGIPRARPEPHVIFPFNRFVLPDGTSYTIEWGDTLWGVATDYIVRTLQDQVAAYRDLRSRLQEADPGSAERAQITQQLESILESTWSSAFAREVRETLESS